jgi:hypothetical protein
MSVPPFYSPYPISNPATKEIEYYIDGEIRDTLSSHVALDHGCDNIICSWTHTPYHYMETVGSLTNYGLPSICLQAIFLIIQKKIMTKRSFYTSIREVHDYINDYLKSENISDQVRSTVLKALEEKLDYKPHVKFIDIYPDHKNDQMFFSSNFSLSTDVLARIVKTGYKKTMRVFRQL